MTNSKNSCLIIYTSSMTLFGANDYAISQTKRFSTLIPLDVLPRNKKKMGEPMNQPSFSESHYHLF